MGILDEIVRAKKERLEEAKRMMALGELKASLRDCAAARRFEEALRRRPGTALNVIAEVKRASPSGGVLRDPFDPAEIAKVYSDVGSAAISVLTEEDYFRGALSYLAVVRNLAPQPVLRKDFIFDEYQVYESRASGADAILLIAAILGRAQMAELVELAHEVGLEVLCEVHDLRELDAALMTGATVIGINNRDLKTMRVSLDTTLQMIGDIPPETVVVSESGIRSRQDVERLERSRVDAVLVGTALMKERDVRGKYRELFLPLQAEG